MKNLFTILLALLIAAAPLGCEKEEKEDCKCDECPCEMIRDAGPEEEEDDLGLDAGQEAGDQDVSGEEAGQQQGLHRPVHVRLGPAREQAAPRPGRCLAR